MPSQIPPPLSPFSKPPGSGTPLDVVDVKPVELALIRYYDEYGAQQVQLGVVGENTVHLLEGKITGFSRTTTPQGPVSSKLRDNIFKKLRGPVLDTNKKE